MNLLSPTYIPKASPSTPTGVERNTPPKLKDDGAVKQNDAPTKKHSAKSASSSESKHVSTKHDHAKSQHASHKTHTSNDTATQQAQTSEQTTHQDSTLSPFETLVQENIASVAPDALLTTASSFLETVSAGSDNNQPVNLVEALSATLGIEEETLANIFSAKIEVDPNDLHLVLENIDIDSLTALLEEGNIDALIDTVPELLENVTVTNSEELIVQQPNATLSETPNILQVIAHKDTVSPAVGSNTSQQLATEAELQSNPLHPQTLAGGVVTNLADESTPVLGYQTKQSFTDKIDPKATDRVEVAVTNSTNTQDKTTNGQFASLLSDDSDPSLFQQQQAKNAASLHNTVEGKQAFTVLGDKALPQTGTQSIDGLNTALSQQLNPANTEKLDLPNQQSMDTSFRPKMTPVDQVSVRIAQASKQLPARINIQLEPAELGRVEIRMEVLNGNAKVVISVDKPETMELLQRDAKSLEKALAESGIKTDAGNLNFNLRGEGQHQFAESDNAPGNTGDIEGEEANGENGGLVTNGEESINYSYDGPINIQTGIDISV